MLPFGGIRGGKVSQEQSYIVSGTGLKEELFIVAPPDFQLSLIKDGEYVNQLLIGHHGGTLHPTKVFVKFSPRADQKGGIRAKLTHLTEGIRYDLPLSGRALDAHRTFWKEDFNNLSDVQKWKTFNESGTGQWQVNPGNSSVEFISRKTNERDWIISPSIPFDGYWDKVLRIRLRKPFSPFHHKLWVSIDDISDIRAKGWKVVDSDRIRQPKSNLLEVSLKDFSGKGNIAFSFSSTSGMQNAPFVIDRVSLRGIPYEFAGELGVSKNDLQLKYALGGDESEEESYKFTFRGLQNKSRLKVFGPFEISEDGHRWTKELEVTKNRYEDTKRIRVRFAPRIDYFKSVYGSIRHEQQGAQSKYLALSTEKSPYSWQDRHLEIAQWDLGEEAFEDADSFQKIIEYIRAVNADLYLIGGMPQEYVSIMQYQLNQGGKTSFSILDLGKGQVIVYASKDFSRLFPSYTRRLKGGAHLTVFQGDIFKSSFSFVLASAMGKKTGVFIEDLRELDRLFPYSQKLAAGNFSTSLVPSKKAYRHLNDMLGYTLHSENLSGTRHLIAKGDISRSFVQALSFEVDSLKDLMGSPVVLASFRPTDKERQTIDWVLKTPLVYGKEVELQTRDESLEMKILSSNARAEGLTIVPESPGELVLQLSKKGSSDLEGVTEIISMIVEKAPLEVAVEDSRKNHGDENPRFSAKVSGFIKPKDRKKVKGKLTFDVMEGNRIVASGLSSDWYDIRYKSGKLIVDKIPLLVKVQDTIWQKGEPFPAFKVKYEGFVSGDSESELFGELKFQVHGNYIYADGLHSQTYSISYQPGVLETAAKDEEYVARDFLSFRPNPANNKIIFSLDNPRGEISIVILNILGTEFLSMSVEDQSELNISSLKDGTYIMQVKVNGEVHSVKKLIVNNKGNW
ncbi:MAG: T9SS type A sorting domain-containing protein [Cytophagales bacterium]|nr:T9SS type A sorting domain-containing protein [Cytophagales bacterium]